MKKRGFCLGALLGLLLSVGICLLAVFLMYFWRRDRAFDSRPLVLIHNPLNHDRVQVGEGLLVHATARSERGVRRIELWTDSAFVAAQESPAGEKLSTLVFSAAWKPDSPGSHVMIVRAVSVDGEEGQATISVEAVGGEEAALGSHIVRDGETFESIAGQYDLSTDALAALNPDVAAGGIAPGDEMAVPGGAVAPDEAPGEEGGAPPAGAPPTPDDPAPGSISDLVGELSLSTWMVPLQSNDPVALKVEALSLDTDVDYEALHCYVSLGDFLPRWFPDTDSDQTSDESFDSLGSGAWDVAAHLSGDAAPFIMWPGDQPFPLGVSCVSIAGDGAEAIPLGRVDLSLLPSSWDGVIRSADSAGGEGSFTLSYRLSRVEVSRGEPIYLDRSMTPPTNLRMGAWTLHWDYEPRPDEEPIDGFRIYLNGELQWVEPPERRQSYLPYEWLSPPCGVEYRFTVTAFRLAYPDGPESLPSNVVAFSTGEPGDEACTRTVIVDFETLTTDWLGGDQGSEEKVGLAYGSFYVNGERVRFDGRCRPNRMCNSLWLEHHSEYDVDWLTTVFGSGPARLMVDVPMGEGLVVGFDVRDEDSWPNADDQVCAGSISIPSEEVGEPQSQVIRGGEADFGYRCWVTYNVRAEFGSPVGEAGNLPPLPMLEVEDLSVDESTGQLRIHVRNIGAGTWPGKDLEAVVSWPSGEHIGAYTWPELVIRPGDTTILQHPDLVPQPHPALGACVLLDPGNEVPEENDRQPGWRREPYCRPLPDLTITGVEYDLEGERLLVRVVNLGRGSVDRLNMDMQVVLADGRYLSTPAEWWANVSMASGETVQMEWPGIGAPQRELLRQGYRVRIDPNNDIAEEDGTNNEYSVPAEQTLRVRWQNVVVPYYRLCTPSGCLINEDRFQMVVLVQSPRSGRLIADWTWPPVGESPCKIYLESRGGGLECIPYGQVVEFRIAGDEHLEMIFAGDLHGEPFAWGRRDYSLGGVVVGIEAQDWATEEICPLYPHMMRHLRGVDVYPEELMDGPWTAVYSICRLEE